MSDADELERMAAALRSGQSIEQWRPLIERLFQTPNYQDRYAAVKRDRLLLKDVKDAEGKQMWDVKRSAALLSSIHGLNENLITKISHGSTEAVINREGKRLYKAMSKDEKAARIDELLSSPQPPTQLFHPNGLGG